MNRNEELIALAQSRGAPEYLINFMRAYPNYVPSVGCFITTAYQQYVLAESQQ
jgi:hypothetical protein